jgi:hypothetical protein
MNTLLFWEVYLSMGFFIFPVTYIMLPRETKESVKQACNASSDSQLIIALILGAFIWPIPVIFYLVGYSELK